jgi:hypothetical protein
VRCTLESAIEGYDDDEADVFFEQVDHIAGDCSAAQFIEGPRGDPMPSGIDPDPPALRLVP